MKLEIKSDNPNYLAKVVRLPAPRKHNNADKLACVGIAGSNVITGLDAKEGDLYVFFPLESALNLEYLSYTNSFEDSSLNRNKEIKGFFKYHGRIRAIKLRGERSEGYIVPVGSIEEWLKFLKINFKFDESMIDQDFDYIDDLKICEKYINREALRRAEQARLQEERRTKKKVKRESKLVENQFRLHEDTEQLKRNIHKINLNDTITISYKLHGTSVVVSKVLCKKPLKWYEKILKKLGVNIIDTHYDLVYSSRCVIKNQYADKVHASYYAEDIYGVVAEKIKDSIKDGISIYGEIVGYLSTGKAVQPDYDYGCVPGQHAFYVYRMTYTNPKGDVFEFTTKQIERYCLKFGLNIVPVYYYGSVRDYLEYNDICNNYYKDDTTWRNLLVEHLVKNYNEKKCYICKNDVPEEGIVLTLENDFFQAFKLKSFNFLERESKQNDKGEVNIEDQESAPALEEAQV